MVLDGGRIEDRDIGEVTHLQQAAAIDAEIRSRQRGHLAHRFFDGQ
jgi:hypothetical protein